jgi:predicted dehydrogenase
MGGWYLPDWHVREDYRREYAAQKKLGGGVVLTSLSHFFDLVAWFFGDIQDIAGARMRLSDLDIDVDDAVVCTLRTSTGVAVTLSEDFLCRCPRRSLRINAEHGYLEADFNRKTLSVWDARKKRFHPDSKGACINEANCFRILEDGVSYDPDPDVSPLQYSGNDAYLSELTYFLTLVSAPHTVFDLDIDAGVKVLEALHHAGIEDWTICKRGK